jgi:hypothetical protein
VPSDYTTLDVRCPYCGRMTYAIPAGFDEAVLLADHREGGADMTPDADALDPTGPQCYGSGQTVIP